MTSTATNAGPCLDDWSIHDDLVRLREWGSNNVYALSAAQPEWLVGSSAMCALRLLDSSARLSRLHARLVRTHGRWSIQDLGSKNGLLIDGARCESCVLEPGIEVGLGGITLIAESPRSIALRGYLARLLGWSIGQLQAVDRALRALRLASAHRSALLLCGPEDLVPIAQGLHRRALGPERPFVVCDPRRRPSAGDVRVAANVDRAVPAVRAAAGGSLCVRGERLPPDFAEALELVRRTDALVQLVVCTRKPARSDLYAAAIAVPPVARRGRELGRIITEYAGDALAQLGAPPDSFTARDRDWVRRRAASSLAAIEKATLRLIAVRTSGRTSHAAERLGMSHTALADWIERKRLR
jgi:Inner membrane component of T3SS, cytoplasmic domain